MFCRDSFASTMVGQSEQLIQEKNRNIMKAIIGSVTKILWLMVDRNCCLFLLSCLFYLSFSIQCESLRQTKTWSSLRYDTLVSCYSSTTILDSDWFSIRNGNLGDSRANDYRRWSSAHVTSRRSRSIRCKHIGEFIFRCEKHSHHCHLHLLCSSNIRFLYSTSSSISTICSKFHWTSECKTNRTKTRLILVISRERVFVSLNFECFSRREKHTGVDDEQRGRENAHINIRTRWCI